MLKMAKKYGVTFAPPKLSERLKNQMPLWYHISGVKNNKIKYHNGWATCLRMNHEIKNVGELTRYAWTAWPHNHKKRTNCACPQCKAMRTKGCKNPTKCLNNALIIIKGLTAKWCP
ncbi:hypothetical protein BD779DRAFT_1393817, partial [Infundibulicybe gibba]